MIDSMFQRWVECSFRAVQWPMIRENMFACFQIQFDFVAWDVSDVVAPLFMRYSTCDSHPVVEYVTRLGNGRFEHFFCFFVFLCIDSITYNKEVTISFTIFEIQQVMRCSHLLLPLLPRVCAINIQPFVIAGFG
jgi:hypothetical protein